MSNLDRDYNLEERRRAVRQPVVDDDDEGLPGIVKIASNEFKLSLKEIFIILTLLVSLATAVFNFNEKINKAATDSRVNFELLNAKLTQNTVEITKLNVVVESLKEQIADIERVTSMLYQRSKTKP